MGFSATFSGKGGVRQVLVSLLAWHLWSKRLMLENGGVDSPIDLLLYFFSWHIILLEALPMVGGCWYRKMLMLGLGLDGYWACTVYLGPLVAATTVGLETSWVTDNDASIHVTFQNDFFASYTPGDYGAVRMGDDGLARAVGIGNVCLETNMGTKLALKGVKHMPDMRLHLISTDRLDIKGFCNTFNNGQWKLTKDAMIVARGTLCSSWYLLHAKIKKFIVNIVETKGKTELWHKRLGHMSEKWLMLLCKNKALLELDNSEFRGCANCFVGKQNMVFFKSFTPLRKAEFDVPNRVWTSKDVSYNHLRVFRCKAFVHVPKDGSSKFDVMKRQYQTIKNIEKPENTEWQHGNGLLDLDPTPPHSVTKQVRNKAHEDHDGIIDPDVPISVEIYYDVLKDPEVSSSIVLRRSNRDKHLPM
ncbi:hypothetical protein Patl1_13877 [Pistacia atlantica]|uniref:Uncharacterized protein n=1 Tax=Pistacia atlantica TaxID=434234 RepID=A0ACC1AVY1_9ROSI|nr:hypothetical protein Patl1_13877 [Pistacia atlantica]